jgi:hypothetical protein
VRVELTGATPNTTFDVYVDVGGGSAGNHVFVDTLTTNNAGDAVFTGTVFSTTVAATIDNELVLQGDSPSNHQYIRELFVPCPE